MHFLYENTTPTSKFWSANFALVPTAPLNPKNLATHHLIPKVRKNRPLSLLQGGQGGLAMIRYSQVMIKQKYTLFTLTLAWEEGGEYLCIVAGSGVGLGLLDRNSLIRSAECNWSSLKDKYSRPSINQATWGKENYTENGNAW